MTKPDQNHSHSHMGMMALCVALMGGAFFFFSGSALGSGLSLSILAPLVICVGAHFLMHRFMGHGGEKHHQSERNEPRQVADTATKNTPRETN